MAKAVESRRAAIIKVACAFLDSHKLPFSGERWKKNNPNCLLHWDEIYMEELAVKFSCHSCVDGIGHSNWQ